jgi:hypothetical protein
MFDDGDHRWTRSGDPVIVTALDERDGDIPNWDTTFTLEAEGWPETIPAASGPQSMTWRRRAAVD